VRRPPVFGLLASEAEKKRRFEQEENRLRTAFVLKFRLLAKHFEIQWDNSPDMWGQLALELALAHVPGMQIVDALKRGKGAPPKLFPTIFGRSRFVSEVDAIAAKRKRGIRDAVIVWKSRNKSNDDTEETLRGRYYRDAGTKSCSCGCANNRDRFFVQLYLAFAPPRTVPSSRIEVEFESLSGSQRQLSTCVAADPGFSDRQLGPLHAFAEAGASADSRGICRQENRYDAFSC
jgi:hypothetical protein